MKRSPVAPYHTSTLPKSSSQSHSFSHGPPPTRKPPSVPTDTNQPVPTRRAPTKPQRGAPKNSQPSNVLKPAKPSVNSVPPKNQGFQQSSTISQNTTSTVNQHKSSNFPVNQSTSIRKATDHNTHSTASKHNQSRSPINTRSSSSGNKTLNSSFQQARNNISQQALNSALINQKNNKKGNLKKINFILICRCSRIAALYLSFLIPGGLAF